MGGTTSKFEENDWELADGKLLPHATERQRQQQQQRRRFDDDNSGERTRHAQHDNGEDASGSREKGGGGGGVDINGVAAKDENDDHANDRFEDHRCPSSSCTYCSCTLDGREPTSKYGIYYITKRKYNQREFDITDGRHNLLYTTRAVPGTIFCFDVYDGQTYMDDRNHNRKNASNNGNTSNNTSSSCNSGGGGMDASKDTTHDDRNTNGVSSSNNTNSGGQLLRITVDLARRYWIVYRYRIPSFPGQKHDEDVTNQVRNETADEFATAKRMEPNPSSSSSQTTTTTATTTATPLLFKRACITVSWSRYMAVSAMFGPPSVEMLMNSPTKRVRNPNSVGDERDDRRDGDGNCGNDNDDNGDDDTETSDGDSLFLQATNIAHRMIDRTESEDKQVAKDKMATTVLGTEPSNDEVDSTGNSIQRPLEMNDDVDHCDDDHNGVASTVESFQRPSSSRIESDAPTKARTAAAPPPSLSFFKGNKADGGWSNDSGKDRAAETATAAPPRSGTKFHHWIQAQSQTIREKSQQLHTQMNETPHNTIKDPLEGVVNLDGPLLLCQEIYTKLIGNHQTTLIQKERVLELLRQDMAQHLQEHPEDVDSYGRDDIDNNPILSAEDLALTSSTSVSTTTILPQSEAVNTECQNSGTTTTTHNRDSGTKKAPSDDNEGEGERDDTGDDDDDDDDGCLSGGGVEETKDEEDDTADHDDDQSSPGGGVEETKDEDKTENDNDDDIVDQQHSTKAEAQPDVSDNAATKSSFVEKLRPSAFSSWLRSNFEDEAAVTRDDRKRDDKTAPAPAATTAIEVTRQSPTKPPRSSFASWMNRTSRNGSSVAVRGDDTNDNTTHDIIGDYAVSSNDGKVGNTDEKDIDPNAAATLSSALRVVQEDQPLVGYWHWEHSLRGQAKMKLHVAKNADLALHVVLAIIVNQVRYERNAIAMTV